MMDVFSSLIRLTSLPDTVLIKDKISGNINLRSTYQVLKVLASLIAVNIGRHRWL